MMRGVGCLGALAGSVPGFFVAYWGFVLIYRPKAGCMGAFDFIPFIPIGLVGLALGAAGGAAAARALLGALWSWQSRRTLDELPEDDDWPR